MILLVLISSFLVAPSHATGCQRLVCYYTNWAQYRPAPFKFFPEDIDVTRCTHINFAFAKMEGNQLKAYEWNDESTAWSKGMYEKTVDHIVTHNSAAKLLLSVGGWNMGTSAFTAMVATQAGRNEFASSSIEFLRSRNFHGLDLDFEYPGSRGSPAHDKQRYVYLVQTLRAAFESEAASTGKPKLLLTAAVSAGKNTTEAGYNVAAIQQYFDFINIMTYDLHGAWDDKTGHNSPLYKRSTETGHQAFLNVDWAAKNWVNLGLPKHKLVLGLATYGRTFKLKNPSVNGMGAPAAGAGPAGTYTREAGFKSYYEVYEMIKAGATVERDPEQRVPYLYQGSEWVGYEDQASLIEKVQYMKTEGYGGVMIWALDLDDFKNSTGQGYNPLLTAIDNECKGIPYNPLQAIPLPQSQNPSLQIPPQNPSLQIPPQNPSLQIPPQNPSFQIPPSFPPATPLSTRPSLKDPAVSGLRPSGPYDYKRPDPNKYSARHGAQTRMFRVPASNSNPQQVSRGASAVQEVVSTLSKGTFVLPAADLTEPVVSTGTGKLDLRPSPNFETYSQRESSTNERPPRQREAIPMVDVSFRADAPMPFNPIRLSEIPMWQSVRISQTPVRKSSRTPRIPFQNTVKISQNPVRTASRSPRPAMRIAKAPSVVKPSTNVQKDVPAKPNVSGPSVTAPKVASKEMVANLNSFLKQQTALTGLFTSNYLTKLLRGGGGEGRGGVKINPYNDDSTDDFNCFMREDGFYPSPSNCRNFFVCKSSVAFVKTCQEGLVYNPNYKLCDWESNYNCQVAIPELPTLAVPGVEEVTREPPSFCSGKSDGRYSDPATCRNFIDCVSSHTYIMPCAAGTVFNSISNGCDIPQNVPGCNA